MNIPQNNSNCDVQGHNETDSVTTLELQANKRILYFSDGVMEEISSSESDDEVDMRQKAVEVEIHENELYTLPHLRYKARQMADNILSGIDYVGGGLASFFGITTPKFASELEYYKRTVENEDTNSEYNIDGFGGGDGKNNNFHNIDNHNEVIVLTEPRLTTNKQ